jgi:hypothetical protein
MMLIEKQLYFSTKDCFQQCPKAFAEVFEVRSFVQFFYRAGLVLLRFLRRSGLKRNQPVRSSGECRREPTRVARSG